MIDPPTRARWRDVGAGLVLAVFVLAWLAMALGPFRSMLLP